MARKNSHKTISIIASIISIITCCGLLSNAYSCSEESNESISNDLVANLIGWHLVTNVNQLNSGDYVTFAVDDSSGGMSLINDYRIQTKNFDSLTCSYNIDISGNEGSIVASDMGGSIFQIIEDGNFFLLGNGTGYLTSHSNSTNTCVFLNEVSDNSRFQITFNGDYAVCSTVGTSSRNTLKANEGLFSLYSVSTGSFPYIFKWYGPEEPIIEYTIDLPYMFNFTEYDFVSALDYVLQERDYVCPILENNGQYYAPICGENGNCGPSNMVVPVEFYGTGIGAYEKFSFYECFYYEDGYYTLDSVTSSDYDPSHNCSCSCSLIFKHYLDDYDTWRKNDFHSSYLGYNDDTVIGELGFYPCTDFDPDNSPVQYVHFGVFDDSLDDEWDTSVMLGMYGQIDYWLVKKV